MITLDNGFLIHNRKYKETSSIVSILSSERGIYSLLFKGKERNKNKYNFSLFNEYQFTFNQKYELPIISKFELVNRFEFDKKYYLLGLYINELVYKTVRYGNDYEKIYTRYRDFLIQIKDSTDTLYRLALIFEKELLEYLGYGLDIASDTLIINDESYFYDDNFGFRKSSNENSIENTIGGNSLKMFLENLLTDENEIKVLENN